MPVVIVCCSASPIPHSDILETLLYWYSGFAQVGSPCLPFRRAALLTLVMLWCSLCFGSWVQCYIFQIQLVKMLAHGYTCCVLKKAFSHGSSARKAMNQHVSNQLSLESNKTERWVCRALRFLQGEFGSVMMDAHRMNWQVLLHVFVEYVEPEDTL